MSLYTKVGPEPFVVITQGLKVKSYTKNGQKKHLLNIINFRHVPRNFLLVLSAVLHIEVWHKPTRLLFVVVVVVVVVVFFFTNIIK